MKLLTKFNLVLLIFFGAGGLLISPGLPVPHQRARSGRAAGRADDGQPPRPLVNTPTDQIKPLLLKNPDHEINFLPQTVPAFAAITIFTSMRKSIPDYSYREATLNPTNLIDRAEDWEADIVRYFADHPDEKQLLGNAIRRRAASFTWQSP